MSGKSYRLVDDGYPTYKKICTGRKWIGRVCKTQNGFFGIIGKTEYQGKTEDEAFREVVARHCGHASANTMSAVNSEVRAINRQRREEVREIANQMISGDFSALDKLFSKKGTA